MPTELDRIRELSGLQQEAPAVGLTAQQKQGLDAINAKYGKYIGYGNGGSLPVEAMERAIDPGSTLWADDKEENELKAYMKKMGYKDLSDMESKDEEYVDNVQLPISDAMADDLQKVLGDYNNDSGLAQAAKDYLGSLGESAVQEAPASGDQALAKEIARLYKEMVEVINDNSDNPDDIESDYNWGYGPDDDEEARALMKAFNTSLQAGLQLVKKIKIERGKSLLGDESDWDPFHPQSERHNELKAMFAKYGKKFTEESAAQPVNSSVDDTIQRARAQIETLEAALKEDYKKFQGMKPYKPKKK